ncbi:putative tubulin polyglutamylase TTLL2, partial [Gonioctena quinquepunctata]
CKWTLRQLRRYFQQAGISDWLLWQRITSLVILTVLSHVSQIPPTVNCFEFFGFDVLIDNSLRPWLLEWIRQQMRANPVTSAQNCPLSMPRFHLVYNDGRRNDGWS